jgi:hypothetical protein
MFKEMLFRPNFCANCGEKIERADWGIFTSRRFCQVCESVFKGQELIPQIVAGICLVIGLFGIGGYLKSGSYVPESQFARQPRKLAEQAIPIAPAAPKEAPPAESVAGNKASAAVPETQSIAALSRTESRIGEPVKPQRQPVETSAEMYFCGAETKKGTPCKHRVKGNIRCFQHAGMPAMLPPVKLRIG